MARQRQRARDRKGRGDTPAPEPDPGEIHREDIPGALDHASGVEEEFEASIVAGAGGVPAPADAFGEGEELDSADIAAANALGDDDGDAAPPDRGQVPGRPTRPGGFRVIHFLRASWAELQRVQWPDRKQVAQATGVVAGFVVIAGLYLGLADAVAQKLVDYILGT